jgi:hypothetical protein
VPNNFLKIHSDVKQRVLYFIARCRRQSLWQQLIKVSAEDCLKISERIGNRCGLTLTNFIETPDVLALVQAFLELYSPGYVKTLVR